MKDAELIKHAGEVIASRLGGSPLTRAEMDVLDDQLTDEWRGRMKFDESKLYGDDRYAWSCLNCYAGWTRTSARFASNWFAQRRPRSVFDLFGGIGLAAIRFALDHPKVDVACHITVDLHREVARELIKFSGAKVKLTKTIHTAEAVTAFEAFEHVREPLPLLRKVTKGARLYVDASSFTVRAAGHFDDYIVHKARVKNKATMRQFNSELRRLGFAKVAAGWNSRPACWERKK